MEEILIKNTQGEIAVNGYAFQLFDILIEDVNDEENDDEDESDIDAATAFCQTVLFGTDVDGKSVCAIINGFEPSFFVQLPNGLTFENEIAAQMYIKNNFINRYNIRNVSRIGFVSRSRLCGYVKSSLNKDVHCFTYTRLSFKNIKAFLQAHYTLKKRLGKNVCEGKIPFDLQFCDAIRRNRGKPAHCCGWVGAHRFNVKTQDQISSCDVEIEMDLCDIEVYNDIDRLAPINLASWDIECISASGGFPDATKAGDEIVVIGTTYQRMGTPPSRPGAPNLKMGEMVRTAHVLGSSTKIENATIYEHESETSLIDAWAAEITRMQCTCMLSYNGKSFDAPYVLQRSKLDFNSKFTSNLSKLKREPIKPRATTLSSKSMGSNDVLHLKIQGCFELDMFHYIKNSNSKLKSLKLNDVSRAILKDDTDGEKIDLPYSAIGEAFSSNGTSLQRAEVAAYCCRDCDLPLKLAKTLLAVEEICEMSRVCHTLPGTLLSRGQQIKVFSHLYHAAHELNCILNDPPAQAPSEDKYAGATVLDPTPGFYNIDPVVTLDFASLYPSVMRANNLCPSTYIIDEDGKGEKAENLADKLPCRTFELSKGRFATFVDQSQYRGIIPTVLSNLLDQRKKTRREAKETKDEQKKKLLNSRQLAYKVCANSVYGFFGVSSDMGMYPLKEISETTTFIGRQMIDATKKIMESDFNAEVIYGDTDSVMVIFPRSVLFKEEQGDVAKKTKMELVNAAFDVGAIAAQRCTDFFGDGINELECEKVSFPYLLFAKKMYAAKIYEQKMKESEEDGSQDVKGLACVRRDTCDLASQLLKDVLHHILKDDINSAISIMTGVFASLKKNEIPFEDFVLSKRLGSDYKNENCVQVQLCKKME